MTRSAFVVSILITLFLSWIASLIVYIDFITIFIIVQVISFFQAIIGNYLGEVIDNW